MATTSETIFSNVRKLARVERTSDNLTFSGDIEIDENGRINLNGNVNSATGENGNLNYREESNTVLNRSFNGNKDIEAAAWVIVDAVIVDFKAKITQPTSL